MAHKLAAAHRRRVPVTTAAAVAVLVGSALLGSAGPVAATSPPQPVVTAVTPASGPASGGNEVVISGEHLELAYDLWFGDQRAEFDGPVGRDTTSIRVAAPQGLSGTTVDVAFNSPSLPSNSWTADDYRYDGRTRHPLTLTPATGIPAGGTEVVITGEGVDFKNPRSVKFGSAEAQIVSSTATSVTVKTPAGNPGSTTRVSLTTAAGDFEGDLTTKFRYGLSSEKPVVTGLNLRTVLTGGGEVLTITGKNLQFLTDVRIGNQRVAFFPEGDGLAKGELPPLAAGSYDLVAVNELGESANTPADDLTVIASVGKPVITSISPARATLEGGGPITIRGRNLATTRNVWFGDAFPQDATGVKVISAEEVQAVIPPGTQPGLIDVFVGTPEGNSFDAGNTADDFTYDLDPRPLTVAPNHGLYASNHRVRVSGFHNVWNRILRGELVYPDGSRKLLEMLGSGDDWVEFDVPAGKAGETAVIALYSQGEKRVNTDQDTFTWDATDTPAQYGYSVDGFATLKTLAKGRFAVRGKAALSVGTLGDLAATFQLADSSARLVASGFLPVTARFAFVQVGTATGQREPSGLFSLDAKFRMKVKEVKLFGAIPLAGGNSCQTKQVSTVKFASTGGFSPLGFSMLSTFALSDLNGCGVLNGLVSPLTAGGGNTLDLSFQPLSAPASAS